MDWLLSPALWGFADPVFGSDATPPWAPEECAPAAIDLWLIQLVYETVAVRSLCERCGASLGRDLLLVPSSGGYWAWWRVSVMTRCYGWRRHRHIAEVVEASNDLQIGQFHAV